MTKERAEEIRKAIWAAHGWGTPGVQCSPEEELEIYRFWNTISGSSSFYDAVSRMARGEHLRLATESLFTATPKDFGKVAGAAAKEPKIKKCQRCKKTPWKCWECGSRCCEHLCSLKKLDGTAICGKCKK